MKRSTAQRASVLAVSIFLALPSLAPDACAATRTWTGTTSSLWSNAGNWGGVLPVAGDDLVFPAGAGNTINSNDLPAGTPFSSVTVNAAYLISGNAVTLTAPAALTFQAAVPANIDFTIPVTLVNAAAAIATPQPDTTSLSVVLGPVTIGGGALLLPIAGNVAQV